MKTEVLTLAAKATVKEDGKLGGVANSLTQSRDGILITQDAVNNLSGKKVPLLANHDWLGQPIGSATMQSVDKDGLHYTAEIFKNAPDRDLILEAIEAGVDSVSVGFQILNRNANDAITKLDLLELSITPVPADSKATIGLMSLGGIETQAEDSSAASDASSSADNSGASSASSSASSAKPASDSDDNAVADALNAINDTLGSLCSAVSGDAPADDGGDDSDETAETEALLRQVMHEAGHTLDYETYHEIKLHFEKLDNTKK